jgi:hypothetical protein
MLKFVETHSPWYLDASFLAISKILEDYWFEEEVEDVEEEQLPEDILTKGLKIAERPKSGFFEAF